MNTQPRFDLHMHSSVSDGTLAPAELMQRAADAGMELVALTDHDTIAGLSEARAAAESRGMRFINGVELTADWRGRVVHLVGLNFDTSAAAFETYMQNLMQLRDERAREIARKLHKKGLPENLYDLARDHAGESQIGRPHFAKALLDLGKVSSMQEAFDRYLGQGTPGDVKATWPSYTQAIDLVVSAGGVVILAHPTKYNFTFTKIRELMTDLLEAGALGLEVSFPGVTPGHQHELIKLAKQRECYVSAGSDFHSPDQRWTSLGRYPEFTAERLIIERLCAA
ncbi:MAG: PHP domain-containing protein [Oceanospirillaceae bacterium]|nr:PHP domain-containing protein [Oceanospirillaceae bacterium]